ncbi:MerR family transcriptional regulator [Antrihabitans sp. NCIMB 15449]|uniref:MerR family transcriptional regulator n=1 Tax=Antrihabitans spumae TaxID=3373370 RepID=A0ABW7JR25_9NOCA
MMSQDGGIDTKPTATESPAYTVRAVAERIGVPTPTLRSWSQRYGVGPQGHQSGRHRYYTEADIAILEQMVALMRAGASPGSAARAATGGQAPAPDLGDTGALIEAAFRLDTVRLLRMLEEHVRHYGIVATWDHLCRPAFGIISERQYNEGGCIDVEHLLSWTIVSTLHRMPQPTKPDSVVLVCADDESHTMPLEVLRAALSEANVSARMLGSLPASALADALTRTELPTTVVVWSMSSTPEALEMVNIGLRNAAKVWVAGPGWDDVDLRTDVSVLGSLGEAVAFIR